MLRICHPADFKGFYFYDKEKNNFSGPLAPLFNEGLAVVMQGIKRQVNNLTHLIEPSAIFNITSANSDNFQGCVNALQANQSDLLFAFVEYPNHSSNITQGFILFESILTIGSMYQKNVTGEISQVLNSFKSFSTSLWFMCLFTFICLASLLKMKNSLQLRGRNRYSFLYTATHMMRLNRISGADLFRKIIFLSASVYSLVVVHYFCILIKTELVTARDPVVFRSYQDIIDRQAQPFFVRGMSYDAFFTNDNAPDFRRHLWKYATDHFQHDDLYVDLDPAQFLLSALAILMEKQVIITDTLMMPTIPASGCPIAARDPQKFIYVCNNLKDKFSHLLQSFSSEKNVERVASRFFEQFPHLHFDSMPGFNFFTAVDPHETSYNLGVIMNQRVSKQIQLAFHRSFRRTVEAGLHLQLAWRMQGFDLMSHRHEMLDVFGERQKSRRHLAQECESCAIIKPDTHFHPLTLLNFTSLLELMVIFLPFLSFILLLEVLCSPPKPRKSTRLVKHSTRKNALPVHRGT